MNGEILTRTVEDLMAQCDKGEVWTDDEMEAAEWCIREMRPAFRVPGERSEDEMEAADFKFDEQKEARNV